MPKTYSSIWVHTIWTTKNRAPLISKEFRLDLCRYIRKNAREKGIIVDMINGVEDHLHALIRLKPSQAISAVMKQIKGASSRWINENEFLDVEFSWQQGYAALSVSPDDIDRIRGYIRNQQVHHREWKLEEELQKFRSSKENDE